MDVTGQVAKGAQFLDERFPGWKGYIDTDALDLTSYTDCVLGQLATKYPELVERPDVRDFSDVTVMLGKNGFWMREFGFAAECGPSAEGCACTEGAGELREEWIRVIRESSGA